jgi:hypothetical protein
MYNFTIDLPDLPVSTESQYLVVSTKINDVVTETPILNDDKTFTVQVNPGDRVIVKAWIVKNVHWEYRRFWHTVEGTVPTDFWPQWCWEFTVPQDFNEPYEVPLLTRPRPGRLTK